MSFGLSGGFVNVVVVLFKFKNNWLDLKYICITLVLSVCMPFSRMFECLCLNCFVLGIS